MSTLLEDVKASLGITFDDTLINSNLTLKINATKNYLVRGGLKITDEEELDPEIIGCIATGVNDLLNSKAGETKFSPAFKMLAMQLCSSR